MLKSAYQVKRTNDFSLESSAEFENGMHLAPQPDTHPARLPATAQTQPVDGTSRPFRILMVAPTSFFADYGCHVRILEEARILQQLGHEVTLVTYHNGKDVPGLTIYRTLPIPWRRHYEVGSSRHKIAFDGLLGLKTLELLARQRFDVIHAHLHEGALISLVLGKIFGVPTVFDFQGSLTEEMIDHNFLRRDSMAYRPLRGLENWIDRKAPIIFTSSANAERILLEEFQCRPEQVQFLPDCVNTDNFRPAAAYNAGELEALRQQLGIPPGAKLIVYLGLLAEYQGTGQLLEALHRILQKHDNVYLLLMGFPGLHIYRRKAEELGIAHAVVFTGRIPYEDAPRYLALGDVAAAPKLSLTEGSGKLLNYMAIGLPTVAYDTPVAREYLGMDGLLAIRGDVESLAAKLSMALFPSEDNPTLYLEAGQRLRQRAIQQFSWQQAGQKMVAIYRQLVYRRQDASALAPTPR
jgi:glycosyltransferase involved in cell wall biosynthesis